MNAIDVYIEQLALMGGSCGWMNQGKEGGALTMNAHYLKWAGFLM